MSRRQKVSNLVTAYAIIAMGLMMYFRQRFNEMLSYHEEKSIKN